MYFLELHSFLIETGSPIAYLKLTNYIREKLIKKVAVLEHKNQSKFQNSTAFLIIGCH